MPELPEVETIRRALEKNLVNKSIKAIEIRKQKIFKGNKKEVVGKKIKAVKRRAKFLLIELSGNNSLLIHLKLTGQLIWVKSQRAKIFLPFKIPFAGNQLPAKTTHIIFKINGGTLFYNNLRQFGWIKVCSFKEVEDVFRELGPEPLGKDFNVSYLKKVFSKTKRAIKIVLMDQKKIAGIGNIYANEALFLAKINPLRPANSLKQEEIKRLKRAIVRVLKQGIKYGGSSASDEAYIQPTGERGEYQKHFRVYQKEGKSCPRCKRTIKRIILGGRGTFFCPFCQK